MDSENMTAYVALMDDLYNGVSGYVSYKPGEKEEFQQEKIFLTYGEIKVPSIGKLANYLNLTQDDVFYDLGSGIGKVTMYVALATSVAKVLGIEASQARHDLALQVRQRAIGQHPDLLHEKSIEFSQGNFLNSSIEDATVVYTCSTCFNEELLADIAQKLNGCHNLRAVASMKPLPALKLPLRETLAVDCSWDSTKCYVYMVE